MNWSYCNRGAMLKLSRVYEWSKDLYTLQEKNVEYLTSHKVEYLLSLPIYVPLQY